MIKGTLIKVARIVLPGRYWRWRFKSLRQAEHEPELVLVPLLASDDQLSIDIGASGGLYVAHLVDVSRHCVAFEPGPVGDDLQVMISTLDLPARVERVALSDTTGEARMRVLVEDLGRSTIEDENNLDDPDGSARDDFEVAVRTLDSFQFDDVGFMKIDVEGHELAVLRGASETIGSNRPNLLVEVEDRHKPNATAEVFALMNGHRYRGYFLHAGDLHPVENFSLVDHQDASNIAGWREEFLRTGTYINNFVFVPEERSDAVLEAARRLLAQSR